MKIKRFKSILQIFYGRFDMPDNSAIDLYKAAQFLNDKLGEGCARYSEHTLNQLYIKIENNHFRITAKGKIWTAETNQKEALKKINIIGKCLDQFVIQAPIKKF